MSQQNRKQLTVGLFGFGTVGEGLYRVLEQKPSFGARIQRVCIKDPNKPRNAPESLFTTDRNELLADPEIDVIVELIDDAEAAYSIAAAAFAAGKHVVSANKALVASHFPELLRLQEETGCSFLYEGACCASIPVLRNLEEYYDNDLLQGLRGIVNGSTNYILTKVSGGLSFEAALYQAQVEGFAESDPTLDINGTDAANKLVILLAHAYGIVTQPAQLLYNGIQSLQTSNAVYAREKGYRTRLVAHAQKLNDGTVAAFVLPQFVKPADPLFHVGNEYNSVLIESGLADTQSFYGKGAGAFPTSSAVLSDLSAIRYGYRYEYKKYHSAEPAQLAEDFLLRVYISFEGRIGAPYELFQKVEEWYAADDGCYVTGTVQFRTLRDGDWWRRKGVSLILLPDAIVEDRSELTRTKTTALLAGISPF